MGDTVNTAARLMQAAEPGRTVVGAATQVQAAGAFVWKPLPALHLKGKTQSVRVFAPHGVQEIRHPALQEPSHHVRLIGREAEFGTANAAVASALQGRGRIVGVTGEAGLGKSRLVAELAEVARRSGLDVYAGACQSFGTQTPYLVWRDIWRSFFGIDGSLRDAQRVVDRLSAELESIAPGLAERAPLLASVLGVPLPDNELTASSPSCERSRSRTCS